MEVKKPISEWSVASAIPFIKSWEGCRLEAYRCTSGVATIGWGHTKGVSMGDRITIEEAEKYLNDDLIGFQQELTPLISVMLTEGQFQAIMSFVFNVGVQAFKDSTLRKKLNAGDFEGAQAQFGRWVYDNGKILKGLEDRRKAEAELFAK